MGTATNGASVPTPRQMEALDLRKQGLSYTEIGRRLQVTHARARELIVAALKHQPIEEIEEVRKIEVDRLDRLWEVAFHQAEQGSLQAVDRCLGIMARRAQYLGLDTPKRHEVTTFDGDSELDRSIRELLGKMATRSQSGATVAADGTGEPATPE